MWKWHINTPLAGQTTHPKADPEDTGGGSEEVTRSAATFWGSGETTKEEGQVFRSSVMGIRLRRLKRWRRHPDAAETEVTCRAEGVSGGFVGLRCVVAITVGRLAPNGVPLDAFLNKQRSYRARLSAAAADNTNPRQSSWGSFEENKSVQSVKVEQYCTLKAAHGIKEHAVFVASYLKG